MENTAGHIKAKRKIKPQKRDMLLDPPLEDNFISMQSSFLSKGASDPATNESNKFDFHNAFQNSKLSKFKGQKVGDDPKSRRMQQLYSQVVDEVIDESNSEQDSMSKSNQNQGKKKRTYTI